MMAHKNRNQNFGIQTEVQQTVYEAHQNSHVGHVPICLYIRMHICLSTLLFKRKFSKLPVNISKMPFSKLIKTTSSLKFKRFCCFSDIDICADHMYNVNSFENFHTCL